MPKEFRDDSDDQEDLVAPSGVNEVNLDDDSMEHPRGKTTSQGGTEQAQGGDSAPLGPPAEIQSDRNGPSDRPGRG
jgi:hypothetical protein